MFTAASPRDDRGRIRGHRPLRRTGVLCKHLVSREPRYVFTVTMYADCTFSGLSIFDCPASMSPRSYRRSRVIMYTQTPSAYSVKVPSVGRGNDSLGSKTNTDFNESAIISPGNILHRLNPCKFLAWIQTTDRGISRQTFRLLLQSRNMLLRKKLNEYINLYLPSLQLIFPLAA